MADISSIVGPWTRYEDTINRTPNGDNMGKEDFLKLLVAQLTHQDPTNPMQDTEFVTQLATYSGLEQQMNMNANLEKLIASNNANTSVNAVGLINKVVGYKDSEGNLQTGLVQFIDIVEGDVYLYLHDKSYIPFSSVQQVANYNPDETETPKEDPKTEDPSGSGNTPDPDPDDDGAGGTGGTGGDDSGG